MNDPTADSNEANNNEAPLNNSSSSNNNVARKSMPAGNDVNSSVTSENLNDSVQQDGASNSNAATSNNNGVLSSSAAPPSANDNDNYMSAIIGAGYHHHNNSSAAPPIGAPNNNTQSTSTADANALAASMNNDNATSHIMSQAGQSSLPPTANNNDNATKSSNSPSKSSGPVHHQQQQQQQQTSNSYHPDLPFLVTHWLSNYDIPPAPDQQPTLSSSSLPNAADGRDESTTSVALLQSNNANNHQQQQQQQEQQREERERMAALQKIRNHASQLAIAFQTLGAFGTSVNPLPSATTSTSNSIAAAAGVGGERGERDVSAIRTTTYSDMARKYSPLLKLNLPNHQGNNNSRAGVGKNSSTNIENEGRRKLLDTLVNNNSSSSALFSTRSNLKHTMLLPWSLVLSSYENIIPTEEESLFVANMQHKLQLQQQKKLLLVSEEVNDSSPRNKRNGKMKAFSGLGRRVGEYDDVDAALSSSPSLFTSSIAAANASRNALSLRTDLLHQRNEIEETLCTLNEPTKKQNADIRSQRTEEVDAGSQQESELNNIQRVVAQLDVRATELQSRYDSSMIKVVESNTECEELYTNLERVEGEYYELAMINGRRTGDDYHQPSSSSSLVHRITPRGGGNNQRCKFLGYGPLAHTPGKNNIVMSSILSRQYGGAHPSYAPPSSSSSSSTNNNTTLSILKSRLSHAVTISSHLIYPVYCLKFDKTGRYFVTGSDDQTVKVFYLGASAASSSSSRVGDDRRNGIGAAHSNSGEGSRPTTTTIASSSSFNYGDNMRGAVLVCTLNGHAGVVTDIDISSDNVLLATSSADGDVRIWRLNDGHPVAILRGHKDGANMVSWSKLTPYRLVTCGEDGLARMWDVREAVLKKCGDYYSWLKQEDETVDVESDETMEDCNQGLNNPLPPPPPPPPPVAEPQQQQEGLVAEVVPPADNNAAGGAIGGNIALIEFGGNYGEFVANNRIDKGVNLVAQLQHGAAIEEGLMQGRVTRTTGKPVKVMCIARCPVGGHFATGSDDGKGRVWADDHDWQVERLDHELSEFDIEDCRLVETTLSSRQSKRNAPSTERLLATLHEHQNPVTDLTYSGAGDRIMTASMKDGIAIIWSGFYQGSKYAFSNISKVIIKLNPVSQGGPSTANVHCDGVAWTCDDSMVITSQSSPSKDDTITEIIRNSNMIYVWDSLTGKCLLGIMSSHSSLCSALAPHPRLPSVIATAGADGIVNVWDLDRGDCFYTHTNKLFHGPCEPASNRGKSCGYLDAQFSPDGLKLVLSDEGGRITVLDTHVPAMLRKGIVNVEVEDDHSMSLTSTPAWMKEQYFANDYYELLYDSNGYCIERGSAQPPHRSPGGVRCTHEGVPYPEDMREIYRGLKGPLPLSPSEARWHRDDIRSRITEVRLESGAVSRKTKTIRVKSPDFIQRCDTTAIITKSGTLVQHERKRLSLASSSSRPTAVNRNSATSRSTSRQLSSRYEWRDALDSDDPDRESDYDSDYGGNGRRLEESSSEDEEGDGSQRSGRRRRGQSRRRRGESPEEEARPSRASSRQVRQQEYHELNSDDEALEEMMSTHTKPSGKFVDDWNRYSHLFKMPRGEGMNAQRKWVSRISRHDGNKTYCPQVGDSVVYVPRAHYDTLMKYPVLGYSPPWTSWPTSYSWPVVRCKVKHVRYRFPYETYYRSRSRDDKLLGIAAIYTLEITGVPTQPIGRTLPWPAPSFTNPPVASRTRSHELIEFEVTLFECNEEDFLIPEYLYSWRVKQLERAMSSNGGRVNGLSCQVSYPPDDGAEEDADHVSYDGQLVAVNESSDDEFHLVDSGYHALTITWDLEDGGADDEVSLLNVWSADLTTPAHPAPAGPIYQEEAAMRRALRSIERLDPSVKDWFFDHADATIYTDYFEMIEVPMYISLIQKRLRGNYYTNKLSVLSDIELVKENCYKYNEDGNEMYELACQMYDEFESLVDDIVEEQAEEEESSDEAGEDEPIAPAAAAAAKRRAAPSNDNESDDSGQEEESNVEKVATRRTSRRSTASQENEPESPPRRSSSRTRSNYFPEDETSTRARGKKAQSSPDSPSRRSKRAKSKPTYTEKESDEEDVESSEDSDEQVDEIDEESEDDASEEEPSPPPNNKGRRAPRARGKKPSYTEKDSDDEDEYAEDSEQEDDLSEDDVSVNNRRKRRGRQAATSNEPAAKRSRRSGRATNYPELPQWSSVTRRQIARVGAAVLAELRELDTQEFFTKPVIEAFPEVEDEYLGVVKYPMDFRTIEEERLPDYGNISELQDDLILTFRNCCEFNSDNPEYYNYAIEVWQQLNDVFERVR